MTNLLGYSRYKDDPGLVSCPRAKTDMTPCIARDGELAQENPKSSIANGGCVGCGASPANLLRALVREVTEPDTIVLGDDYGHPRN